MRLTQVVFVKEGVRNSVVRLTQVILKSKILLAFKVCLLQQSIIRIIYLFRGGTVNAKGQS